ncbi:MAG TPA: hypothetical protein VHP11_09585 [Tepidisphaeraceae bacterium]|nr:hypothetical protein [Tepidisphaeraceae bacterium]
MLVPVAVLAGPTTQPAPKPWQPPERPDRMGPREVREGDWEEALKFFQKHSPHRIEAWESMSEPRKSRFKNLFAARYFSIVWLSKEDSQLRRIKIRQIEVEDQVFAIKSQLLEGNLTPADTEQFKQELRGKVKELVLLRMDERKERITGLETLVKMEKERLQKDIDNQEQVIESQYNDVLNANRPDMGGDMMRRHGPGPGGDREGPKGPPPSKDKDR